jgi:hypothetical protein
MRSPARKILRLEEVIESVRFEQVRYHNVHACLKILAAVLIAGPQTIGLLHPLGHMCLEIGTCTEGFVGIGVLSLLVILSHLSRDSIGYSS